MEILSKEFTKLNNPHAYRIHYLGPRFSTTAALHKKYGHSERDSKLLNSLLLEGEEVDKYSVDRARIVDSYLVQERLLISNYYKGDVYYRAFEGMNPTLDLAN